MSQTVITSAFRTQSWILKDMTPHIPENVNASQTLQISLTRMCFMCLSVQEYEISSDFNSKFGREADFSDDLPANFYRESGVKSDPSR